MNTATHRFLVLLLTLATAAGAFAAGSPAGPRGGRIVTEAAPHVEFFVDRDRAVVVSFYDDKLQPVAPAARVVAAIVGRTRLEFVGKDGAMVSTAPLPEGDGYTVVLQVRESPEARPVNYRVVFHDEECPGCKRAEYACTCDHAEADHGHRH